LIVWTIGHSTRPLQVFLDLLAAHGIQALADVRRFPGRSVIRSLHKTR
jgi:uncharacterized protein (DUF488 family)